MLKILKYTISLETRRSLKKFIKKIHPDTLGYASKRVTE